MIPPPINLPKWLEQNSHLLKPPIGNYCLFDGDFTIMVVGGPNARTDFHINPTAEYFYQHRGAMVLRIVSPADPGSDSAPQSSPRPLFRDVIIREGDMFLLPGSTPHSPIRFTNTVGVVVEQRRPEGAADRLRWYCGAGIAGADGCGAIVHEAAFVCTDLGTQVKAAVETFRDDEQARRCAGCGRTTGVAHPEGANRDPNLE